MFVIVMILIKLNSEKCDYMANTTMIYAHIDIRLKEYAEEIFSQLGITKSSVIQMLYS